MTFIAVKDRLERFRFKDAEKHQAFAVCVCLWRAFHNLKRAGR